ncbi:MAG: radical SAM protein [Methanomicrobiales archaeon]|nr:radical SAM protein [Methanomicrobiales archaeon]
METNCTGYRTTFDATVHEVLQAAVRIIAADPALLVAATRILHHQKKAAAVRGRHERDGLLVPPVIIASITSRCNLACAGCYMQHRGGPAHRPDMSPEILSSLAAQADDLGVSVLVIAGGEPLVRLPEILAIAEAHPALLVPVFTNGLLIDDVTADRIAACRNIVPLISFEGFREETDSRRGSGIYDRLLAACGQLKDRQVFFGISVTTTRVNMGRVTDQAFIRQMMDAGARAFTYVEYVPMEPGTQGLVLEDRQKKALQDILGNFNRTHPALFLCFPGNEDYYGGCLAAGRGFVHVSPAGDLEPCPAAPYSDRNLAEVPLAVALRSRLLARLREKPEVLAESEGGCALHANRAWVERIVGWENSGMENI